MITLKLQGRLNDGTLTGRATEIVVVDGQHAEDTLVKFHGPRAWQELGYLPGEKLREFPACGSVVNAQS